MLFLINFRLQYEGALKYLGESVTGLKFGIQNWWDGLYIAVEDSQWGCQWVHRQTSVVLLHMCSAFPAKRGKQMIVMAFSYVMSMLMHRVGGYIRRMHMSLKAFIWVFGAAHSGNLLRSHWPSVAATSVPFMEQEYIPTGKCSLFVHLHVPKGILDTLTIV